uniref:Temporin-1Lb n=1 Tax=Rana luteiventris TaxID=58176 RepID=TP1B_RANLU|nr:RecName: Full=Temporin-1Lb [Rana luteiventris]
NFLGTLINLAKKIM